MCPSSVMSDVACVATMAAYLKTFCEQVQSSHSTAENSRTKWKSLPALAQSLLRRDLQFPPTRRVTPLIAVCCNQVPHSDFSFRL